jgi:hypothetical protein
MPRDGYREAQRADLVQPCNEEKEVYDHRGIPPMGKVGLHRCTFWRLTTSMGLMKAKARSALRTNDVYLVI